MKKIILLGDHQSGKTTLLKVMLSTAPESHKHQDVFESNISVYQPTESLEVGSMTIMLNEQNCINLQIWDTPSSINLQEFTQICAEMNGFVVLVKSSVGDHLNCIRKWHKKIEEAIGRKKYSSLVFIDCTERQNISAQIKDQIKDYLATLSGSHECKMFNLANGQEKAIKDMRQFVEKVSKEMEFHKASNEMTGNSFCVLI